MPKTETLQDIFIEELRDAYDAEQQLVKALTKMSDAATHADLKQAFTMHREETTGQIAILEEVFASLDEPVKGKHCAGIAGIIEEGNEAIEEKGSSPILDTCLVGGGKRAEHYEMAAYSSLIAMADQLGYDDAADLLQQILDQEIAADEKLDDLAEMLLPLADNEDEEDGE